MGGAIEVAEEDFPLDGEGKHQLGDRQREQDIAGATAQREDGLPVGRDLRIDISRRFNPTRVRLKVIIADSG